MRKISKKQIGAMGLAVMMTAQSPAMAAEIETSQTENTVVTQEATQEDSQEEATVVEDVSAAEQETVTEQETVSEQDSVMVQETASEENAIEETSIEVVTEETDELTTEAVEEGKNIVAAQSAITDGWHTDNDGNRTYVKNGSLVTEEVIFIDNAYYGFDQDGKLYVNTEFFIDSSFVWDGDQFVPIGAAGYYRAKSDGTLYQNEWYEDSDGNSYYYGEECTAYEGIQQVSGNYYYFNGGRVSKNALLEIEGAIYVTDSDGKVTELLNNQWTQASGDWYYVKNEKLLRYCVEKINGSYYGFDSKGKRYTNTLFSIESNTYRAKSDGSLYVNEWYRNEDGTYYYYDENGHNIRNKVQKIGDSYYGFDLNGKMYADTTFSDESGVYYRAKSDGSLYMNEWYYNYTYKCWMYYGSGRTYYTDGIYEINNTLYYFDKFGSMVTSGVYTLNDEKYVAQKDGSLTKMPENGWFLNEGKYYYIKDGEIVKKKILEINGAYYAFKADGVMVDASDNKYEGNEFYFTDESGKYIYCRAKEDGSLYTSLWVQDDFGNWKYYCEDGHRAVSELVTINGNTYYFNYNGEMMQGGSAGNDLFDESGIQIKNAGWNQTGGKWYYLNQDGIIYTGILTENGHTYYLNPEMITGKDFIEIDDSYYKIDSNGYLSKLSDGFYSVAQMQSWRDPIRYYYYLINGKLVDDGWKIINNEWYYFSNGAAYCGGSYKIDGKLYYFDSNGILKNNGWFTDGSGVWCYAFSSGELATGDCTINGVLYHFEEDGRLKSGTIQQDNAIIRYGDDGSIAETIKFQEGWNLVDGVYYYLKDGMLLKNTTCKLSDGNWYSFDESGRMRNNIEYEGRYYSESGAAMTGWIYDTGKWYYADPEKATLYSGFQTINGVEYYFMPKMLVGERVVGNDVITANDSGEIVSIAPIEDGWSFHDGDWYYYQDGKPYTGQIGTYLVEYGKMVETDVWIEDLLYRKADGNMAYGWTQIAGDWYYFTSGMTACKQEYSWDSNGKIYVFNEKGVYIPAANYAQGWNLIDGYYYYKEGESFLCGTIKQINGDWYAFNTRGRMITGFTHKEYNGIFYDAGCRYEDSGKYYYGSDGRRCYYTGWQMLEGNWYYFNNYSEAASGWKMINGVKYYFDTEDHYMYTGYHAINGELYYFNADGSCWGKCGPQSGWYQAEGKWYFMKGGYVTTGSVYINGITYQFDKDGVMQE